MGGCPAVKPLKSFVMRCIDDLLYIAGGALLSYGAYETFRPAGFVVAGLLLIGMGLLAARDMERKRARGGGR